MDYKNPKKAKHIAWLCIFLGIIIGLIGLSCYWRIHLLENEVRNMKLEVLKADVKAKEAKSLATTLQKRVEIMEESYIMYDHTRTNPQGE